jgi:hypothetical protein
MAVAILFGEQENTEQVNWVVFEQASGMSDIPPIADVSPRRSKWLSGPIGDIGAWAVAAPSPTMPSGQSSAFNPQVDFTAERYKIDWPWSEAPAPFSSALRFVSASPYAVIMMTGTSHRDN